MSLLANDGEQVIYRFPISWFAMTPVKAWSDWISESLYESHSHSLSPPPKPSESSSMKELICYLILAHQILPTPTLSRFSSGDIEIYSSFL